MTKYMKTSKYIFGALAFSLAMGMTSCGDSFLEEDASAQISDGLLETGDGALAMAAGLYGNLRWHFGYEWAYGITLYGCDEFTSAADLTSEPWNTYDNRLNPLDCTTANGAANGNCPPVSGLWNQMYYGISTANLVISKANSIADKDSRNKAEGEARFLRAYNYYRLFCQYGGVVLDTVPANGVVKLNYKRASEEEVLNQIIADLEKAHEMLPTSKWRGNGTWTKYTAAHFLAKALLYRQSERCSDWNSKYTPKTDLEAAIKLCDEVIDKCPLVKDYKSLYADWTGVDCANEGLSEILMAAEHNGDESTTKGRFGNRTYNYFNPQFSNFSGGYVQRGQYIGGMDFQRCRPTEYAYAAFDNVNDSRMWKTFKTIYGYNNYQKPENMQKVGCPAGAEPTLGQEGIMFILNTKNYDPNCGTYGRGAETHTFVNPETGKWVPNVVAVYEGGKYIMDQHGVSGNPSTCNFFCGINKTDDGTRTAEKGDAHRDVIMARTGETVLVKAECQARLGDFKGAITTINTLRERAQWKSGEDRGAYCDGTQAFKENTTANATLGKCLNESGVKVTNQQAFNYSYIPRNTYWISTGLDKATVNGKVSDLQITVSDEPTYPTEDEAILAKIGCTTKLDRMLNFIMNERTRELLGEWNRWDELTRTKLLVRRAKAFNNEAKAAIQDHHMYRPIPQSFIDALQTADGKNLSDEEKKAWQNPGY